MSTPDDLTARKSSHTNPLCPMHGTNGVLIGCPCSVRELSPNPVGSLMEKVKAMMTGTSHPIPDDLTATNLAASCESHRRHTVGCLACAAEECARTDLDLGDFLGHMERLGWPEVDA